MILSFISFQNSIFSSIFLVLFPPFDPPIPPLPLPLLLPPDLLLLSFLFLLFFPLFSFSCCLSTFSKNHYFIDFYQSKYLYSQTVYYYGDRFFKKNKQIK